MATLDDKLLGEKLHYYCSSSEDEDEDVKLESPAKFDLNNQPATGWQGTATNTGPKGVVKDWQRFRQLENECREEERAEHIKLAKKLTHACRTTAEDDLELQKEKQLEEEIGHLLDDEGILKEFIKRRMEAMRDQSNRQTFGEMVVLDSAEEFLNAVDQEQESVTVIVHIYNERWSSCLLMNEAMVQLSHQHPYIKWCRLSSDTVGLSKQFRMCGLPALVVYKHGAVIGNFVRLEDNLGYEFCTNDVENFLVEHGVLEDSSCAIPGLNSSSTITTTTTSTTSTTDGERGED